MKKTKHKQNYRFWVVCALVLAFLAGVVAVSFSEFNRYTQKQIYQESISQLTEISNQLFEKLSVQLNDQWDRLYKLDEDRAGSTGMTVQEMADFLTQKEKDLSPAGGSVQFIALDQHGYYYTTNGQQGLWAGAEQIDGSAQQSFLVTDWLTNKNQIVFAYRLQSPLTINGSTITHFVLLRSIEDIAPFFRSSVFHNQNTTYLLDANGVKMFEDTVLPATTFAGRNLYHALRQLEYTNTKKTFDEDLAQLGQEGFVCTSVMLSDGQEYYIVLKQLDGYSWTMVFFVPQSEVATSTRSMVNSLLQIFIVAVFALAAVSCAALVIVMRLRQNQHALAARERINAQLEAANTELEKTNARLIQTQATARIAQVSAEKARAAAEDAQAIAENAQAAAETASRAKTEFLANMSHDIRTPMNAIVGIARLMGNEQGLSDKMHTYIAKILMSSQHLLSLINDVLDMSKIESGEVRLNSEPVSLAEQIGQVDSIIRPQAEERGQEFKIFAHEIVHEYVIGDSVRLRQVFINLLSNAVKYTDYNGKVTFALAELPCTVPDHAAYRITVTDNGCGMTPEFIEHIFEPFSRAENSTTNKVQGTGLGMAITKNIVDLMGGTITVESEPGSGSRFEVTVTMPIDKSKNNKVDIKRILLIADDAALIRSIGAALQETGVTFHAASTEAQAAAILQENPAEVILLAGHLHDKTLAETVRLLRGTAQDAVLIFCCDYAQQEQVHDILLKNGVDGLIARPFFLSNLVRTVEQIRGETSDEAGEHASVLKGARFLCAEDNELNAEILKAMLEMNGASCTVYPNGQELVNAFETVKPGDYDMILMDIMMPVMDGLEATRRIRASANPLGRSIPIVAMTANAFSEDIQKSREAGMDAHLSKPMDMEKLKQTVQRFRTAAVRSN